MTWINIHKKWKIINTNCTSDDKRSDKQLRLALYFLYLHITDWIPLVWQNKLQTTFINNIVSWNFFTFMLFFNLFFFLFFFCAFVENWKTYGSWRDLICFTYELDNRMTKIGIVSIRTQVTDDRGANGFSVLYWESETRFDTLECTAQDLQHLHKNSNTRLFIK